MITSVIVAHKGDKTTAILAAKGNLRPQFRELVANPQDFDSFELITSANGRVKRARAHAVIPAEATVETVVEEVPTPAEKPVSKKKS